MHIAWFIRDLRVWDNEAFTNACKSKNVMPLYIIEPELWKEDDLSYRQYIFLTECLEDLDIELKKIGQKLTIRTGDALEIFNDIKNIYQTRFNEFINVLSAFITILLIRFIIIGLNNLFINDNYSIQYFVFYIATSILMMGLEIGLIKLIFKFIEDDFSFKN